MATFSATTTSQAVVDAPRDDIWAALTDPTVLTRLTPLLRGIQTQGDRWHWQLIRLSVLGVTVDPSFTEEMHFTPSTRIDYSHKPPAGTKERAGAEGWYLLEEVEGGTRLSISLRLDVELPLSRVVRPAVEAVMRGVITQTGDRFATNLERHLGLR